MEYKPKKVSKYSKISYEETGWALIENRSGPSLFSVGYSIWPQTTLYNTKREAEKVRKQYRYPDLFQTVKVTMTYERKQ